MLRLWQSNITIVKYCVLVVKYLKHTFFDNYDVKYFIYPRWRVILCLEYRINFNMSKTYTKHRKIDFGYLINKIIIILWYAKFVKNMIIFLK